MSLPDSLVKELKKSHPEYADLIHSLDIWHKSKALRKALLKVAKNKEMEDLLQWVDAIVNHFWHCCENCGSDLTKLKVCLTCVFKIQNLKNSVFCDTLMFTFS